MLNSVRNTVRNTIRNAADTVNPVQSDLAVVKRDLPVGNLPIGNLPVGNLPIRNLPVGNMVTFRARNLNKLLMLVRMPVLLIL